MGALNIGLRSHARLIALAACFAVLLLSACGSDSDAATRPMSVSDAWALATATGQPNGAVYFTITSATEDTLEHVSVSTSIADHTELHQAVTTATGAILAITTVLSMKAIESARFSAVSRFLP